MSDSPPILFIVRASMRDGLGHLVRSLCVLRELLPLAPIHLVLLGDGSGSHLVEAAGVPCTRCETDDAAEAEALRQKARVVVFDTLRFEDAAFTRIANAKVTVSLSPVFSIMNRVDHLFHRTEKESPAWNRSGPFPKVHKGLRYAVLPSWLKRVSTQNYREQLQEDKLAVAISMGGTDAPNRTLALLKLFGKCPVRLVLFVALGDAYTHSYEELLVTAEHNRQEVILLKSNESMWRVLKNASLLLCAGGLTTYEAAYIGLPSINILQHAEWAYLFEELVERGACLTFPPIESSLEMAVDRVCQFERQRNDLLLMHQATKRLIPGNGARRVAKHVAQLAHAR